MATTTSLVVVAVFWATLAGRAVRAADQNPEPWPDLSEPKAAAFSLGVALVTGDEKAIQEIYIGKSKDFFELRDALGAARKSAERLQKAATARFGRNAAALGSSDLELKFGGVPLTAILAVTEVEQDGNRATVTPTGEKFQSLEIKLKKVGDQWKVTDFPLNQPFVIFVAELGKAVCDELAEEIEQGKYAKAYEVYEALGTKLASKLKRELGEKEAPVKVQKPLKPQK